jgi:hypothetical protein
MQLLNNPTPHDRPIGDLCHRTYVFRLTDSETNTNGDSRDVRSDILN